MYSKEYYNILYSKEMDSILNKEIEYIKNYPHWMCAWWTPDYDRNRRIELAQDLTSENKDVEYIKRQLTSRCSRP